MLNDVGPVVNRGIYGLVWLKFRERGRWGGVLSFFFPSLENLDTLEGFLHFGQCSIA